MMTRHCLSRIFFYTILSFLPYTAESRGVDFLNEKKVKVAMRMIGHEMLICWGDTTSRVMPIVKSDTYYRIPFELQYGILPDDLIKSVTKVMIETGVSQNYIVEVEQCTSGDIVHSFQIWPGIDPLIISCGDRTLPIDCYNILVTLLDGDNGLNLSVNDSSLSIDPPTLRSRESISNWMYILSSIVILIGILLGIKSKRSPVIEDHLMTIGLSRYDEKIRTIIIKNNRIQLSNKEAELLLFLHQSANKTISREDILRNIWGDDGDYVGRTLDVFISKLRKKIDSDSSLKIDNIRGIGYKLTIDV